MCKKDEIEVTEMNLKHNTYYRMFKVTVSERFSGETKNDDNWPSGVEIRRNFFLNARLRLV